MYKALDIARYIIERCYTTNKTISNLRLQKILYFIQAEFLVAKKQPCFSDEIQAWDFGPVVPNVYYEYRMFGSANIPCIDKSQASHIISSKDKSILDNVIDECSKYSTSELVEITHNQTPWIKAYESGRNTVIEPSSIKEYFTED